VFNWKAIGLFVATGAGLVYYFRTEKQRIQTHKQEEMNKTVSVGKPKIGGPFTLTNHEGKAMSSTELPGRFLLVYFGFTHCPDICPEEMEKMSVVVDEVDKAHGDKTLTPVFITCDPQRDTPPVIAEYLKDFSPKMVGFTGSHEEIAKVAKSYRVYYSKPPDTAEDYLVDHSIFFYLMDPNGQFVDCYGKSQDAPTVIQSVKSHISQWNA
jgi:protein SCO1/2